jgi:RHH-type rel operon transcriptional repressor/antitoxin RelB
MPTMMSMRIPKELSKALDHLAERTERPKSYLVRKALEVYLAEHADYEVALERLHDRSDEVISGAELRRRLAR